MSELHSSLSSTKGSSLMFGIDPATGSFQSWIRLINIAFVAVAAAYLFVFVYASVGSSILVPYSDMVDLVDDYFRAVDAGKPVEYLLDPHNFHRLPWFRSLIALDVSVLRGTGFPLVGVAVACLIGTALLLMIEVRRAAGGLVIPLLVLVGMLVFLTANAAGVSVPANSPHLHTTFFSLLALVAAASASERSGSSRGWTAAIVCAAAASFSLATALVLWPILMLMAWRGKASWQATSLVAVTSGVFCAAYLDGQSMSASIQHGLDPQGVMKAAEYFFAYLGLPWVRGSKLIGELFGAALLAASAFALIRYGLAEINRTQRLALGMILFSLGGAALAAVGRRDIAIEVDVPVRYAILLVPLHAGLLLLAAPAVVRTWESRPRLVSCGLIAALALMMAQQIMVGTVVVRAAERARQTMIMYQQGQRTPEMLQWIYPDLARAAAVYAEMRRRGVFLQWVGALSDPTSPDAAANSASSQENESSSEAGAASVLSEREKQIEKAP